jgi:hypothetical protein
MPGTGPVSRGISQHPFPIETIEELPEPLLQLAKQYPQLNQRFDFIMVVPHQSFLKGLFGRRHVPQQALLFYPEGVLHVQAAASADHSGKTTWIEARNLCRLQSSLLLLYGKLEIAADKKGQAQLVEVEYNTVGHDLIKPYIQRFLRQSWADIPLAIEATNQFSIDKLADLPYKFQSGLRIYAIQAEEALCGYAYQAEITEPRLGFFRRKVTPNTLLAVTDRQVVLIQEEISSTSNYGWVITHYPRQKIFQIQADPQNDWQIFRIHSGSIDAIKTQSIIVIPEIARQWLHITESLVSK